MTLYVNFISFEYEFYSNISLNIFVETKHKVKRKRNHIRKWNVEKEFEVAENRCVGSI